MQLAQAMGEPCCKCGSRDIIVAPTYLIGACARCSPAVAEERRWNERVAKAATAAGVRARVNSGSAPAAQWYTGDPLEPPRKRFGRLPPRTSAQPGPAPSRTDQLEFPGF